MNGRNLAATAAMVVVTAGASAFVAYRSGLHRGMSEASPRGVAEPVAARGSSGGCVDFREAQAHAGEQTCVQGRVLKVFSARSGNTFLDFCAEYRSCPFTSLVFSSDRPKFGDLNALDGRQIEIRGTIRLYRGQPEIVVSEPGQIQEAP